jgi:copper chaperone CopZ
MEPVRLKIAGIGANADLVAVENALRLVPGVISVRAEPKSSDEVLVEAARTVDPEKLLAAVSDAGYIASLIG